jgi:hypothetical protein
MKALAFDAPLSDYDVAAAELFAAVQSGDERARWRFKWGHPRYKGETVDRVNAADLTIDDARLVVARDYGFDDWASLSRYTDDIRRNADEQRFELAVDAVIDGRLEELRHLLDEQPGLVRQRSARGHHATLLHYVAANGVEGYRQRTPQNAVEIARLLLDRGSDPNALAHMYGAECTTMSMLVSSVHPAKAGLQISLAELLIDRGAKPEGVGTAWTSAVMTALTFGYLDTARALAKREPKVDDIAVAAGLGLIDETRRLLPRADANSRHAALALASQLGHTEVVQILLDAGEDPNRFNPDNLHGHATPLHQAVSGNHLDTVRLLVQRGARRDVADKIFDGTPLAWAEYLKHPEIAEYLRGVA